MQNTSRKLKLIFAVLFWISCLITGAQIPASSFSFSCVKDTLIPCGDSCITLNTTVPRIMSATGSYTVNRISYPEGCFRPYISPGSPGNIVFAADDQYSGGIILPFSFPFYGIFFNSLVVSSNGYISFDNSKANSFSHYGILNAGTFLSASGGSPQNLPSLLYDRALIMTPYHDLDYSSGTSPLKRLKLDLIGTAPHRRWILSFYKVPLYLSTCENLIENTQQLVLYEGSGIVEVFVFGKQVCTGWNQGRAMIGMQNYDRNLGIMAPGRAASDAPWGTVNMKEAWRFTPAGGVSLLKTVELLTLSGQLIETASTTDGTDGNYEVNFGSICPDSTTSYLVKSTYQKIDDPLAEVFGLDTINVIKIPAGSSHSVWTGSVSTAWENPLNWHCGILPDSSSNVTISHGNIVVSSNITVNSLTVKPGCNLVITPGYNITMLSDPH